MRYVPRCPFRRATVDSVRARTLAAETGSTAASSLEEVAQTSNSIITMLPDTPNVEDILLGFSENHLKEVGTDPPRRAAAGRKELGDSKEAKRGLLDLVEPGTLVVDSSTIDPLASRRMNAIAKSKVNWQDLRKSFSQRTGANRRSENKRSMMLAVIKVGVRKVRELLSCTRRKSSRKQTNTIR